MEKKQMTAALSTLGCRVNQYESDAIADGLEQRGFLIVPFGSPADVTVINTCTVTGESDRKSRQLIRRAVSASPGGAVIVTGCYSETGTKEIMTIDGVTYIKGNSKKNDIPDIAEKLVRCREARHDGSALVDIDDISSSPYDVMTLSRPSRARSFIKIEDGCDNRCSYCIIPAARGHARSKPRADVMREVSSLLGGGCREIILTGIEVSSYGRDLESERYIGDSLASIIEDAAGAGCGRIGLGSLEPTLFSEKFVRRIAAVGPLMPHFHLSVQSGSSAVLARMRRKYSSAMLTECIDRLRSAIPDALLSADMITGFPGETEEEFGETLEFVRQIGFLHLHIFPYSERQGTEAAEMAGAVPVRLRNERLRILSDVQKKIKAELLRGYTDSHRSTPCHVLVEEIRDGAAYGHSEHYVEVCFPADGESPSNVVGKIAEVSLTDTDGEMCRGVALQLT